MKVLTILVTVSALALGTGYTAPVFAAGGGDVVSEPKSYKGGSKPSKPSKPKDPKKERPRDDDDDDPRPRPKRKPAPKKYVVVPYTPPVSHGYICNYPTQNHCPYGLVPILYGGVISCGRPAATTCQIHKPRPKPRTHVAPSKSYDDGYVSYGKGFGERY